MGQRRLREQVRQRPLRGLHDLQQVPEVRKLPKSTRTRPTMPSSSPGLGRVHETRSTWLHEEDPAKGQLLRPLDQLCLKLKLPAQRWPKIMNNKSSTRSGKLAGLV